MTRPLSISNSDMKKFLTTFLTFFIPMLCVLTGLEYMVRKTPNEYQYKAEWMEKNADSVKTLVLGSSHAFYGINPAYLGTYSFSIANSAQSLNYDFFLLTKYASAYKCLNRVIMPLSYFTLTIGDIENGKEWWRAINYKVFFDCPYHSYFSKYNFFISSPEPFRTKLFKLFYDSKKSGCDSLGFGYVDNHAIDPDLSEAAVSSWVNTHTAKNFSNVEKGKYYFYEIAKFCQTRNIQLVLISTPVWKTYYEKLDRQQLTLMKNFARELQIKYNVAYYDYMTDNRFLPDDFSDCNHMSYTGAVKLSKILKEDLKLIE